MTAYGYGTYGAGPYGGGVPVAYVDIGDITGHTGGTYVDLGDITGQSGGSAHIDVGDITGLTGGFAHIDVGDITGANGVGTYASVDLGDIQGYGTQTLYMWDGTKWVSFSPATVSVATGRSSGGGFPAVHGVGVSVAKGRSFSVAGITATGTLTLSSTPTLTITGAKNVVPGNSTGTLTLVGAGTLTIVGSGSVGPPGAGSLTITPDLLNWPPRFLIDLRGALGPTAIINRISSAGQRSPVRYGNPGTLSGGGLDIYDYEAPFGQTVTYEAVTATVTITSDPVTLGVTQSWLIHPGIPDLSQPVSVMTVGDKTLAAGQGVFNVLGRSTPIVVTDGARKSPTFPVTLKTDTDGQYSGMSSLLGDASVLLLQVAYDYTDRTSYDWVAVGDANVNKLAPYNFDDAQHVWTLPCTVVDPPTGLLQSQRAWADVVGENAAWVDVVVTFATWRDLVINNPIGS